MIEIFDNWAFGEVPMGILDTRTRLMLQLAVAASAAAISSGQDKPEPLMAQVDR